MAAPIPKYHCDICSKYVNSQEQLTQHMNGSRHKRNASKLAEGNGRKIMNHLDYFVPAKSEVPNGQGGMNHQQTAASPASSDTYCSTCRIQLTSRSQAAMHYQGAKHKRKLTLLEDKSTGCQEGEIPAKKAKIEICEVCNVKLLSPAVAQPHYSGDKHRKKLALLKSLGVDVSSSDNSNRPTQVNCPSAATVSQSYISPTAQVVSQTLTISANPSTGPTNTRLPVSEFHCTFCNVFVNSESQMMAHRSGSKHKSNVEKIFASPGVTTTTASNSTNQVACSMAFSAPATGQLQTVNQAYAGQFVSQY